MKARRVITQGSAEGRRVWSSARSAAAQFGVHVDTIRSWCRDEWLSTMFYEGSDKEKSAGSYATERLMD